MRIVRKRLLTTCVALALAVTGLAGCTPSTPTPTHHSAAPTSTPVFTSDKEALKAATDAYAAYLAMSDTIAHDGGANPERIKPFVTGSMYKTQRQDLEALDQAHRVADGKSTFDSVKLRAFETEPSGAAAVGLYLCVDVSNVRLIDATGNDVTPPNRHDRLPLQVELRSATSGTLVVSGSEVWSGRNFC